MIYNLQLLRAFAALSVVYLHIVSDAGLNWGLGVGAYGVDVFFVISGFTMSYLGRMSASMFLARRVIRIVPLYWAATLGTFAIAWFAPALLQSASADIGALLHSLFFLPFPDKLGLLRPTLALGWTLNYEMYFYLLFATALALTPRFAPLLAACLLAVVALCIQLFAQNSRALMFYAEPIIYEFSFGIAAYYLSDWLISASKRLSKPTVMKVALCALCVAAVLVLPWEEYVQGGRRALRAGVPALLLITSAVTLERGFNAAANLRWVLLLGDSSYVLYLIHPYVIYGIIRVLMHPAKLTTSGLLLSIAALMSATTLVAVAIHVIAEKPLLNWLRRKWSSLSTPVLPLAA